MRHLKAAIAVVLITLLALCGCVSQASQPLPQLVIGYGEYRPYIYMDDNGAVAGSDADLAKEACQRIGYEPVFKEINWENRDRILASGEVDCLWSCFSMNERENDYAWVGPYSCSRQVVAVLDKSPITALSDLKDKSIAVKTSTQAEGLFLNHEDKRIPHVRTVYCLSDVEEMSTALRNEYVDACAGHAATLTYYLGSAGVDYRMLDDDLFRAKLGVAFSKESDRDLRDKLAGALKSMKADGTTKQILESYGIDADKALEGVGDE